jgi:hypothetical protein
MADFADKARIRSIYHSSGWDSAGFVATGASGFASGFFAGVGFADSFLAGDDDVVEGAEASVGASSLDWSVLMISSLIVPSKLSISFIRVWLSLLSPAVSLEHPASIGRTNKADNK